MEQDLTTDVPARMDRLPFGRAHWLVVIALGITWVLDGLEVTIVGALGSVLEHKETLGLTASQVGFSATSYLAGAILGALVFGHLTDRLGRKKLFVVTLAIYIAATVATGLSWNFASFAIFRFLTGMAIGGEYAAVNSAIDELLPARVRGFADLAINGSYWMGTAFGAGLTLVLLDPELVPRWLGFRLAFGLGAVLSASIVLVRRYVPESPRWLMLHGHQKEAHEVVEMFEASAKREGWTPPAEPPKLTRVAGRERATFLRLAKELFGRYRKRTALGLSLMLAQAFFYNAIFFTYALVLTRFYGVAPERVGLYILPFAIGNFLGPLVLGKLFDHAGRRVMIVTTYAASGVLLLISGVLFLQNALTAVTQTALWSVTFFFASSAASSAYLTVSELFPVDIRAMVIALFYALGTAAGGLLAPSLFGALIDTGERSNVFLGYVVGASLMIGAAVVAFFLGVAAEGKSLEELEEHDESAPRVRA